MRAAGGIVIHKGSEANFLYNYENLQTLAYKIDHDINHSSASIEEVYAPELIHVDLLQSLSLQSA